MTNSSFDFGNYENDDPRSQRALYDHLLPYLRAIVNRYLKNQDDVLDVLQESYVKIFRSIESFDPAKGELKSWSAKISINTALNYNRKQKTVSIEISEAAINPISPDVLGKMSNDELLRELKTMPDKYFEVFNLFVIDGYDHDEIAGILKISKALSRKRLSRGREWIKNKFQSEEGSEARFGYPAVNIS